MKEGLLIGQRVRIHDEIVTVSAPPDNKRFASLEERYTWVKMHDGTMRHYANDNIHILPGGQL